MVQVHRDTPSCTILCTYSEEAHAGHSATMLGLEAYTEYKTALLEVSKTFESRGNHV